MGGSKVINKKFKPGDTVRIFRASIYNVTESTIIQTGVLLTAQVGAIKEVLTDPDKDKVIIEDTGGIYLVEIKSTPTYEIPVNSKTPEELAKIIKKIKSYKDFLKSFSEDPKLLGEVAYKALPASAKEAARQKVYLAANSLIKLTMN